MSDDLDRDLLCCADSGGMDNLLFAPRTLVEELVAVRAALAGCATWEDARSALTEAQFAQLADQFWVRADGQPGGDKPLGDVSEWPVLYQFQIAEEWLPGEVVSQFGAGFDGALGSGALLPADSYDEIEAALAELGFTLTQSDELEQFFELSPSD